MQIAVENGRVIKISTIYVMCSTDLIDRYGFIYSAECFRKFFFSSPNEERRKQKMMTV